MNEKETKAKSGKVLLTIEMILIVLGLFCSVYSMINELNRTEQNPQTLEASAEDAEGNGENTDSTAAPQTTAPAMTTGDQMAPEMQQNVAPAGTIAPAGTTAPAGTIAPAGTTAPAGTIAPAGTTAPADNTATAVTTEATSDNATETEGTDAETVAPDQMQPPVTQPVANAPGFMDQVGNVTSKFIIMILPIIMYILAAFYLLISYKKPHGNALRYTMFVFALYLAVIGIVNSGFKCEYLLPVSAVFVAYISGRLHKINKNMVLMAIVGALLLAFSIVEITNMVGSSIIGIYSTLGFLVIWIVLCDAYVTRYNEHKQAGIDQDLLESSEETPKEKVEDAVEEA